MIRVYKYNEKAKVPERTYRTDAGADLFAVEDVFIPLGSTIKVNTGLAIDVPVGFVGKIDDRSSMGARGIKVSGGVIDAGYTGEIAVILNNLTNKEHSTTPSQASWTEGSKGYQVRAGDRIAQILIYKVDTTAFYEEKELWSSARGNNGLGSSGK